MKTDIYDKINSEIVNGNKLYWILLDPDDFSPEQAGELCKEAEECGVDGILIGGSLMHTDHLNELVKNIKESCSLTVMLFPGDASQITSHADAILFMSLVSGRNPDFLIGEQVKAAPLIKKMEIEPIPMGYMLIESGAVTSVEFMSNTRPIPRDKAGIAALHALAAQYLGQKLIYLEAGSGAKLSVPAKLIGAVKSQIDIPIIVGGGIRDGATASEKIAAGADIIVTGNMLTQDGGRDKMIEIAKAIKSFSRS